MFLFLETPNREASFREKAAQFELHSTKLSETAKAAAQNTGAQSKRSVDAINAAANMVCSMNYIDFTYFIYKQLLNLIFTFGFVLDNINKICTIGDFMTLIH